MEISVCLQEAGDRTRLTADLGIGGEYEKMKKSKRRIDFAALLLILSLAGTGRGDRRQVKEPSQTSQIEGTEMVSKTGALSFGYFYGEDGIVVSSEKRFLYSDWEPVEFDYICMDPT